MKENPFFLAVKVLILVTILGFGVGILITGADQPRENTVSIEEP